MSATASPTSRPQLLEPEAVSQHRNVYCPEYDDCLEVAAKAGWRSFSCEHCPLARVGRMPRADFFATTAT